MRAEIPDFAIRVINYLSSTQDADHILPYFQEAEGRALAEEGAGAGMKGGAGKSAGGAKKRKPERSPSPPRTPRLSNAVAHQILLLLNAGLMAGVRGDAFIRETRGVPAGTDIRGDFERYISGFNHTQQVNILMNEFDLASADRGTSLGGGLIATTKAEDAGGLTHIYPLSRANILEMCKHLI
jgi:hypothetical protein